MLIKYRVVFQFLDGMRDNNGLNMRTSVLLDGDSADERYLRKACILENPVFTRHPLSSHVNCPAIVRGCNSTTGVQLRTGRSIKCALFLHAIFLCH